MATENASDTFDVGGELSVRRLGFGARHVRSHDLPGMPDDPAAATAPLRRAVELGTDFVDTAELYGPGTSERLIGDALDVSREELVVATKGGRLKTLDGGITLGDPGYLQHACLSSCDRLRTDAIDLYQLHRPDPDVPLEESLAALAELRDEGFVRHVGLSNVSVEQLERARDVVEIATVQNRYNVADRTHEDVLAYCEDHGIGFIPYFPVWPDDLAERGDDLDAVGENHDATRYQVALAWLLETSPVTLPIPGTSSVAHAEENVAASAIDLADDELARLD